MADHDEGAGAIVFRTDTVLTVKSIKMNEV